jgi:glycosyltransferase involved in cell wall biosynthesis
VAVHANYGVQGTITAWHGIPVFPAGYDGYSNDTAVTTWEHWASQHPDRATVLFTLFDVWTFKNPRFAEIPRIVSWVPIDHAPCPPEVLKWCARPNVSPVAMSRFGQRMLAQAGISAEYVPHAIDTDVFRPGAVADDGRTGRQLLELPDDVFVVGMVAANKGTLPNRKRFAENLMAVAELMRRHDDVVLYMHSEPQGAAGGINLPALMAAVGIPGDRCLWVDQWAYHHGITATTVAALYTMMDVLLACSGGEGFGIPVIEAQACGTPVIVSDWSAQPELVGDGWKVQGQPDWDPFQQSWFHTPFVHQIVESLEDAYGRGPGKVSQQARDFALGYDADVVFRRDWVPVLDRVAELADAVRPVP